MESLIAASLAFVGSHLLMSHPLRAPLVARLGPASFMGLYSLVSFATLGWMAWAAWALPPQAPAWLAGDALWAVASAVMLFGSILFAGSLIGNPALPAPGADALALQAPRGVFAITRHPMMWGFALWALVHISVWPTPGVIAVALAILILALVGAAGQDRKKAVLMPNWRDWERKTAFVPFARGAAWPGWGVVIGGIILWLVATWGHGPLGGMAAGIWRWLG